MGEPDQTLWQRYDRQIRFAGLGPQGQRRLAGAGVLIVGVGGLGSWSAELLCRAGAGFLRLVDPDRVELVNVHRQALYDEADAAAGTPKAVAAAARLTSINSTLKVDPVICRLDASNIGSLADGVDLILDGTDNFQTRFVINDYCVKNGKPWIFGGVIGAEGQVMSVVPGRTACLRCIYDSPPPPCTEPTCQRQGVLGPAVAAISAIQAAEAVKILCGMADKVSPHLLKLDLWDNLVQRINATVGATEMPCPCCKGRLFEYLEA